MEESTLRTNIMFFVATDGNDNWSGRLDKPNIQRTDGPFATLFRARDAIRELKIKGNFKQPAIINVRGGRYFFKETLVFTKKDSGTKDCPIVYTAYPGEKPIISGGRRIVEWKPYKDKILQALLLEARGGKWKFRQLFFNGKRQIRARYPNFDPDNPLYGGWAYIESPAEGDMTAISQYKGADEMEHFHLANRLAEDGSTIAFKYKPDTFKRRWAKPTEGEINICPWKGWGDNCIIPIKSIDERNCIIILAHRTKNFNISPWFVKTSFLPGNQFYVENLLEELDQPSEWCLDSEDGILYFWPPVDSIEDDEVVAPVLRCLIDLQGTAYITVSGFTLTETNGGDSSHPGGVTGLGAMFAEAGWEYCGEAIRLYGAEHCVIENNHIYAVGGNGIYLQDYNNRNIIRYNEISHAGANGVVLAGGIGFKIEEKPRHPLYNEVTYNHIHHCGFFDKYSEGVFLGRSEANIIAHNSIHDLPHHGINLGNDGYGRNIIEYNEIRHTCLQTQDTGAINCWMEGTRDTERSGHIIRHNLIADTGIIGQPHAQTHGIYLDNDTSNCFVYGNILFRNPVGIFVNGGKNNIIENNIIVGGTIQLRLKGTSWCYQHFTFSNRFLKNILYQTEENSVLYQFSANTDRSIETCDYNLFFNAVGREYYVIADWDGNTRIPGKRIYLTDWQKITGFDEHSITVDPLFVNPTKEDYRFKPNSPVLKLGYITVDIDKIGING